MNARQRRRDGRTPMYQFLATLLRPFLAAVTRRDWKGEEYLQQPGGYIIVANHVSDFDPLTTAHFLYVRGRAPKIMAKESLFRVPVLGWFLRGTNMIPVFRGTTSAADSLVAATAALKEGESVLIFPEGTLTKDPALWPMVAKSGAARLALATGAPVIPVAQWGAHRVMPQGSKIPHLLRRSQVYVHAGPPVPLADLQGQPITTALLAEATDRMMSAIVAGVAQIRQEPTPAQLYNPRTISTGDSATTTTSALTEATEATDREDRA